MYARRAVRASGKPPPQIRIFVLYHDSARSRNPCPIRWACRKGWSASCMRSPTAGMTRTNNVVIAHEILHTLGASDKYDPETLAPLFPIGYAEPDREPRSSANADRSDGRPLRHRFARPSRCRPSLDEVRRRRERRRSKSAGHTNERGAARNRAVARRGSSPGAHRWIRLRHPRRRVHCAAGRQWHRQIAAAAHARGTCARLPPVSVRLDGRDIHSLARRDIATRLGFLPQDPDAAPAGIADRKRGCWGGSRTSGCCG